MKVWKIELPKIPLELNKVDDVKEEILKEEKFKLYKERMFNVIHNMPLVVDAATKWYGRIKDEFLPAKRIIVVG